MSRSLFNDSGALREIAAFGPCAYSQCSFIMLSDATGRFNSVFATPMFTVKLLDKERRRRASLL